MACSLPGLPGVHAAKLVEEASKVEQDHAITLDQANAENLVLVTLKRLPTATRIPARVDKNDLLINTILYLIPGYQVYTRVARRYF